MTSTILLYLANKEWLALDSPGSTLLARGALTTVDGQPNWSPFRELVAKSGEKVSVEVIVGGERCHFLSLPWSDALLEPVDSESYIRAAFVGLYGPIASTWSISVGTGAFGHPRLACATAPDCLAVVDALEDEGVISVVSILPSVSFLYAKVRRQLAGAQGVLGFADGAGFSLLRWDEGNVVEAFYLPALAGYAVVHDWVSRTELALGPVRGRYWVAADAAGAPDGWQAVGNPMDCGHASPLALTSIGCL